MASRIAISCPECLARLGLPDAGKLLKKIRCPKCSHVFIPEAEETPDDDEPASDRENWVKRKPTTRKRKRKAKTQSNSAPMFAGGIAAVVILAGVGLYFAGAFSRWPVVELPSVASLVKAPLVDPTEEVLALRWMPAETDVLLHLKIAELERAPVLKPLLELPRVKEGLSKLQGATGLLPQNISAISLGFADIPDLQSLPSEADSHFPQSSLPARMLAVVRTTAPFSTDSFLSAMPAFHPATHNGKTYLETSNGNAPAICIADSSTILIAGVNDLKAAMDRGATMTPRQEFKAMGSDAHLLLIVAPRDPLKLTGPIVPHSQNGRADVQELAQIVKSSLVGFGVGIKVRGGIELQAQMAFRDADASGKLSANLTKGLAEARTELDNYKTRNPEPIVIADLAGALLKSLTIKQVNSRVKFTASIPDSDQEKLEKLPAAAIQYMLTRRLSNPATRPGPIKFR